MTQIQIDWEALEIAVERNSPETESFLDRTSGHVVTVTAGEPEAASLRAKITANICDYLRVEPASSREQYRWMERFANSVVDEPLRRRLMMSIDGKGAFRRFKDVLLSYPVERERWFSYRSNLLHWHIQSWLESHDLFGEVAAPWGQLSGPEELEDIGEATPAGAMSGVANVGEALRSEARGLIDELMPLDLPSAIAFLDFLKERGSAGLASQQAPAMPAVAVPTGPTIVR